MIDGRRSRNAQHPSPFLLRLISSANSLSFSGRTSGPGLGMPLNFSAAREDEWRSVISARHIFSSRRNATTARYWTRTPRVSKTIVRHLVRVSLGRYENSSDSSRLSNSN